MVIYFKVPHENYASIPLLLTFATHPHHHLGFDHANNICKGAQTTCNAFDLKMKLPETLYTMPQ